jgi:excisionase family DNA binding protein
MEFPSIDAGAKLAKRELETFLSDDPALIERRASFWQDPPSDTPTLSRFLSGPPRFSIFCPWTPIQKCAELARLARKLEEPDDDELVAPLPVPTPPQPVPVPAHADGLQTKSQAARRLNISIRTLRGLIKSGELRYVNVGHGKEREKIMFTDSDLDDLKTDPAEGARMSLYKPKGSPYYQFDFQWRGTRFHSSTKKTDKREAQAVEKAERERVKQSASVTTSAGMTLNHATGRYWNEVGQHEAGAENTERDLARLVDYFGPARPINTITGDDIAKLVAWRRGHRVAATGRLIALAPSIAPRSDCCAECSPAPRKSGAFASIVNRSGESTC